MFLITQLSFGVSLADNPNDPKSTDEVKNTDVIKRFFECTNQVSVVYLENEVFVYSDTEDKLSMIITRDDAIEQRNYSFEVENLVNELNLNLEEGKYNVTIFNHQDSYKTSIEVF